MPSPKRCPDCGVELEELEIRTTDGFKIHVDTDKPKPSILGKLGAKEKLTPTAHVCPECGLTRLYVDQDRN